MKKCLLILLFIPIAINSQWKTSSGSNKFDGNYKASYVMGNSNNRTYKNPIFRINSFNGNKPNLYIDNIGYTGCSAAAMEVSFNDFEDILTYSSSSNNENDAAFISCSYGEMIELFQLLKDKNKLYVRYSNNCGNEDFTFNLSGSSNAIDYVTKEYIEKQQIIEKVEEEKRIKEEKEKEEKEIERKKEREDKIKTETIQFTEELMRLFDFGKVGMDKSLVKEILNFKIETTKRIKVISKKCPNRSIVYDKEEKFYASDKLTLFNRIRDNSILLEGKSEYGTVTCSYYITISELRKLTYNNKIKTLEDLWPKLVELCK